MEKEKLSECVVGKNKLCDDKYEWWADFTRFSGCDASGIRELKSIERKVKTACPHRVGEMCAKCPD
jgi:hypothetical protein